MNFLEHATAFSSLLPRTSHSLPPPAPGSARTPQTTMMSSCPFVYPLRFAVAKEDSAPS